MKLYELSKELATINDTLIDSQGEITPELEARLDAINMALEQKADGIRKWKVMIDADEAAIDTEIKRLQAMKKTQTNLGTRLREYVKKNMELAGLKSIKTLSGAFTIAANPPSVECIAEVATPKDFMVHIPEQWLPDKEKIKAAMLEGYDIPGWKLVTDKTNLRIK